ncbi:hypothetical protein BLOT_016630 [Blomia tropicalis]|nr:hypothetical protein BLOT_016630 [Blomia tropicalis]
MGCCPPRSIEFATMMQDLLRLSPLQELLSLIRVTVTSWLCSWKSDAILVHTVMSMKRFRYVGRNVSDSLSG